MKLFTITCLVLGASAAATLEPKQPISPRTPAIGTNVEMLLLSTEGEPMHPAPAPNTADDNPPAGANIATPGTPTTPRIAKVTQVSHPNDPEPIIILPFHFQIIENCMSDASIAARGVYVNWDWVYAYNFPPGGTNIVHHHVSGYPYTFLVGPFDYASSTLHFSYDNAAWTCGWDDVDTGTECGECRAGLWNADKLDCGSGDGGVKTRSKDMDCSFIMGWKSQLTGIPIPRFTLGGESK